MLHLNPIEMYRQAFQDAIDAHHNEVEAEEFATRCASVIAEIEEDEARKESRQ